ncbi:FKBP-type peptidyl-prolyl cis-trans isomerase [Nesterenkonia alba]|uniref:FKBP-type peptidyl-prolyl cis-trans isomerase n=1 Tax=Nesterenkonia alba TaxID=515814 RepID=UPI0003B448F4|nr:FKBP-type peptidyl-prolyl cis-trans isomerase [Nesterenkonia alba]
MPTARTTTRTLALSAAAALILTSCGDAAGEGQGDTDALSGIEINHSEDGAPEVLLHDAVETDEYSTRVVNEGDGDEIEPGQVVGIQLAAVDPEEGGVLQHTYDMPISELMWVADPEAEEDDEDEAAPPNPLLALQETFGMGGVTVGSDLAFYVPADPEAGAATEELYAVHINEHYPQPYATGEEEEQSGELPEIDSTEGQAPELTGHDGDEDAPEELVSEVLISGDGDEIEAEDYLYVQYRGWRWSDGEIFDESWSEEEEGPVDFAQFSLDQVIEGWTEGIPGHRVGDRVLLVIPAEQAYGEAPEEDEDDDNDDELAGEPHELAGETLIFVVDIFHRIDGETLDEVQAQQAPPEQQQPEQPDFTDMSDEELEDFADQMGMSVEELEEMLGLDAPDEEDADGEDDEAEDEADSDNADDEADTGEEDE